MIDVAARTTRTRFAPSPSGHLHVGGARTALFCWAYAKGRGGKFILRIEDTDQKRSSDAASLAFLADLKWLGLEWDEGPEADGCGGGTAGPYLQSQRREIYDRHIAQLVSSGRAYFAFDTAEELDAAREAARASGRNYRYNRNHAVAIDPAEARRRVEAGEPAVVRLRTPDEPVEFTDQVLGTIRLEADEIDDFIIRKADGYPTYHFAVVVDDELMGVTHVIRAQEHLKNTARHLLIQQAMGFRTPVYAHVSVVMNPDGSKMSKRDKDKALRAFVQQNAVAEPPLGAITAERWQWWLSDKDHQLDPEEGERLADALGVTLPEINVDDFRRHGYLPEVLVNYLALLGWSPGDDIEKFNAPFLIERFDLDRIIKSPARFDRDKLLAFNHDAIQAMPQEEFIKRYRDHVAQFHAEFHERLMEEQFRLLAIANQPRCKTLDDTIASSRFFIFDDSEIEYEQSKAVRKALCNGDPCGYEHLERVREPLREVNPWTPETIESAVRLYVDEKAGGQLGKVAQPLRIAVSGGPVSPDIWATLAILGRDSVLRRIDRCLAARTVLCPS